MSSAGEALAARIRGRASLSHNYASQDYQHMRQQASAAAAAGQDAASKIQSLRGAARASQQAAVRRMQRHLWHTQLQLLAREAQVCHTASSSAAADQTRSALAAVLTEARQLEKTELGRRRLEDLGGIMQEEGQRLESVAVQLTTALPDCLELEAQVHLLQRRQLHEAVELALTACPDQELAVQLREEQQELLRSADQRLDDLHRLWQQTNEGLSAFSDDEQTWVKNITAMFSSDRLDTTEKLQGVSVRQVAFELLMKALPHLSREELVDCETLLAHDRYARQQIEATQAKVLAEYEAFLEQVQQLVTDAIVAYYDDRSAVAEQERLLQRRIRLLENLVQMSKARAISAAAEEAERRRQEEETQQLQERAAARAEEQRRQIKEKLEQYKAAQVAEQDEKRRREAQQHEAWLAEQAVQAEYNRQRVELRRQQEQEKLALRAQQQIEAEKSAQEREARLEALRQLVRVEAEADPERLRRPTEAMLQAQAHDRVAREIRSQLPVLGPEKGFTDTAIVSDVRFKIMAALRSAGLEHSAHAQSVLQRLQAAAPQRRDTQTTLFRPDGSLLD